MVDEMEAPEKRNAMIRPVPPPQRVIEEDDGDQNLDPAWPGRGLQQPYALARDPRGHRMKQGRLDQCHHRERNGTKGEIADEATKFGLERSSQWCETLADEHSATDQDDDCGGDCGGGGAELLQKIHSGRAHAGSLLGPRRSLQATLC